ncbi:ribonuclease HII [Maribacter litoralis]|uniref:ribonuclease HII n=1 Tax=Maribacter litoralis TaxID=2059726 RepID=UPI003D29DDEC
MRPLLVYVVIALLCFSCTSKKNNENSPLGVIPENASLILQINDFESVKNELSTHEILNNLASEKPFSEIKASLKSLNQFSNIKQGLLALTVDSVNLDYTFITNDSLSIDKWNQLPNKSKENLTYNNYTITAYTIDETTFYTTHLKEYWVLCSSQQLLQENISSIDTPNKNSSFKQFYDVANNEKMINIWLDIDKGNSLLNHLLDKDHKISDFASWITLDATLHGTELILSGIAQANTKNQQYLSLFENTKPIENKIWRLAPSNSNHITSFGFDEFKKYIYNKDLNNTPTQTIDSLLNTVEEIGFTEIENEKVLFLRTYGTATLLDYLNNEKVDSEEFNGNDIWKLKADNTILEPLQPLVGETEFPYATITENTFIFTTSKNSLTTVISKIKNGDTFDKTSLFKTIEANLTQTSSVLSVSNFNGVSSLLNESVSNTLANSVSNSNLKDYVFASQIIADDGFYHTNYLIKKVTEEEVQNTVSQAFETQFNTDLATLPQFITNHNNGRKEIVVQDQENTLYLISNTGKILWKKQLNGTIQGKIHQVDLFKNGKLQLAFTTNNEFIILDRNGKEVKPFTYNYTGGNLNPLSVFDYEGNKNYRFVVTQGKKVDMYNSKGDIVKGFTYDTAEANIIDSPQHFRIGRKDYLVFKLENGKLKILNRVGKTRINVKDTFSFSDNAIRLYQNKFTFTTIDGILYQIDSQGKISSSNLNLAKEHGMDATSRTLAIMNDNILQIRDKKIELELGVYSKPTIFYLNDKIYVAVTDIQNQKIYVYDSQAEPIPNFPVFGSSVIDMADMNRNKKPEFVFKDQENSINVYKIR